MNRIVICKIRGQFTDVTNDVTSVDISGGGYAIRFGNNSKIYTYNKENIYVLDEYSYVKLHKKVVYVDQKPRMNVQQVLEFSDSRKVEKYAFIWSDKTSEIVLKSRCSIKDIPRSEEIFALFKEAANTVKLESDSDYSFLGELYNRIGQVPEDSILYRYLNGVPIELNATVQSSVFPFEFNLSQKTALKNALSSPISIIEGPPGTGKTQTILNLILNLVCVHKKSVGIASFNNAAVENVKEKLIARGFGFLTADLGRKDKQRAFFQSLPKVDISDWNYKEVVGALKERSELLDKKIDWLFQIDNERAQLLHKLSQYRQEQQYFEQYLSTKSLNPKVLLPIKPRSSSYLMKFLSEWQFARRWDRHTGFFFRLKLLFKYGIFRLSSLLNNEEEIILGLKRKFYSLKVEEIENRLEECDAELEREKFSELLDNYKEDSEKICRQLIYEAMSGQNRLAFDENSYKRKENFENFIKCYPVVLSTNHSILNSIPNGYLLDYAIIDEASQVDLLTACLVFSCCKNVIVVGDSKQLPPVLEKAAKKVFEAKSLAKEYDYCQHSLMSSLKAVYGNKIPTVLLREHYRCHPKIIDFCNQMFYNNELILHSKIEDQNVNPLNLIRTAPGNHMRIKDGDKLNEKGIFNQRELDIVAQEIIPQLKAKPLGETIGFVTPFALQARMGEQCLGRNVTSATVHRYQGRERDVMIFSTVLDNNGTHFLQSFVDDPNLINVSVSRAVKQFVVVTHHNRFEKAGRNIKALIKYIEYNNGIVTNSKIRSAFDLLYRDNAKELRELLRKYHDSEFASENIMHSLLASIFSQERYSQNAYQREVAVDEIVQDKAVLNLDEIAYINRGARVDFAIYEKISKQYLFVIEVDGFAYHANDSKRLTKDRLKDSIFRKCGIPLLRLPTFGSQEKEKIIGCLEECLFSEGAEP